MLSELCSALLVSLPRADQRRKGMEYVRGLLETSGRKSIRNIAAQIGGQATEQALHHFISSSTWDWVPVRRALARHVVQVTPPQAWVIRPTVIPKAGEHSVGVEKRFISVLGQVRNVQQVMGVWAASEEASSPINWRLHLPRTWLEDDRRRRQASIPSGLRLETLSDCAIMSYLETTRWGLPVRPVVLDARDTDALLIVHKLRAAGIPFLVRISSTVRLTAIETDLPGRSNNTLPAYQILDLTKNRRRPVTWVGPGRRVAAIRTSLAATIRVRMPSVTEESRHVGGRQARLLGVSENGQKWPKELWITDLMTAHHAFLLRLSRLIHRVDRDFTDIADRVGVRDFAGRSFDGWHRHVTLASVAHAAVLANPGSLRPRRSWEAG